MGAVHSNPLAHELLQCQQNKSASRLIHPFYSALHLVSMILAVWTWNAGSWPLTILCIGICAHLGHSKLIAFHEASHGTLNPCRWMNEFQGIFFGTLIFVPLSAYRCVHGKHHAHIGNEHDLELWPFVNTGVPRGWRILAAAVELSLGFFYTPLLFLRGVLVAPEIPRRARQRLAAEYVLCLAAWSAGLFLVAWNGWWEAFLVAYLAQAIIAGNLQSLRKYTEHVGLLGDTLLTKTRTVVDQGAWGKLLSRTMLHIDYHGTHHRFARVPYYNLPRMTPHVYNGQSAYLPIFPSYWAALLDMFRSLGNPRIGAQWLAGSDLANVEPGVRPEELCTIGASGRPLRAASPADS